MAYTLELIQINASSGGFGWSGAPAAMNFPSLPFNNLVYSHWVCQPPPTTISPNFVNIFNLFGSGNSITLSKAGAGQFFSGTVSPGPMAGVRSHILMSVDTQTQTIQMYINDVAQTVSGTWTGPLGSNQFDIGLALLTNWNVGGAGVYYPGIGDIWCGAPPSFVDLSIVANRRGFINADLTPVYLGASGSAPLGFVPQIYATVQTGGVPNDLLTNHGSGTGFSLQTGATLSFQASGACTLPIPPPPSGPASGLQMGDLICQDVIPDPDSRRIFLDWSDDRGHTFGNPVGQNIGETGAYLASLQWQRLGYARDRIFRLTWSVPVKTALQGAWIDVDPSPKT